MTATKKIIISRCSSATSNRYSIESRSGNAPTQDKQRHEKAEKAIPGTRYKVRNTPKKRLPAIVDEAV